MDTRKPLDTQASLLMVALCLIWSMQQIAIKLVGEAVSPLLQIALRSGIAFVMVFALMVVRKERRDWSVWRPGLLIGLLFGLEYLCVAQALIRTSASHTVVFLYTSPVFAALGLHLLLPSERLDALQWAGIGLAFAGVAYTFLGGTANAGASSALAGDALALMGGAAWGATTVTIRRTRLSNGSPNQNILYQLGGALVLLLPTALITGQTAFHPSALVWASLAYQTFVMSFASFLVWFWLLRHYLASRLGVFTFLTPLLGVMFGVLLLNEPLEPQFVGGALLVLTGICTVSQHKSLIGWAQRLRPN